MLARWSRRSAARFGCEERVVELRRGGKASCPRRVSPGGGDAGEAERSSPPLVASCRAPARGAGFPARARPPPPNAARGRRPSASPPSANEMCRLSPIAVAISAASANMAAARAMSPSRSAIAATLESDRAIRDTIADPAAQLQALFEVGGRPLVLSERQRHPAEVVQRDREHVVVSCLAGESDRFLARGHCRATIGLADMWSRHRRGERRRSPPPRWLRPSSRTERLASSRRIASSFSPCSLAR